MQLSPNYKAGRLRRTAAISKALAVDGVVQQVEPLALPLVNMKRIQRVAALAG